jgi:hypothetical protein
VTLRLSAAGVHHTLLGGQAGYPQQSAVAAAVTDAAPWWPDAAMFAHRQGLRMVAHLAAQGHDQVLDLGCGYPSPTRRQVHQSAAVYYRGRRRIRTVHVDHDFDARLAQHAAAITQDDALAVLGDITDVETLLDHLSAKSFLDLDRPVAVLLHDVLPWLSDDAATHVMAELRHRLSLGSVISLTHLVPAPRPFATTPLVRAYHEAGIPLRPRDLPSLIALSGTWPTHTDGPHTGGTSWPVCSVLLRHPGPGPFPRPAHWAPVPRRGRRLHTTPSSVAGHSSSSAAGPVWWAP